MKRASQRKTETEIRRRTESRAVEFAFVSMSYNSKLCLFQIQNPGVRQGTQDTGVHYLHVQGPSQMPGNDCLSTARCGTGGCPYGWTWVAWPWKWPSTRSLGLKIWWVLLGMIPRSTEPWGTLTLQSNADSRVVYILWKYLGFGLQIGISLIWV